MNVQPFSANFSKTKSILASSTSASATLDATDVLSTANGGNDVMRIVNSGTKTAFIRWGVGAQTALTTDMPILGGVTEVFTKSTATDTVAAITSGADTTTIYITCGEGQ